MKGILFTLIISLNSIFLFSQDNETYTCESRKKDALKDFSSGNFVLWNHYSNYENNKEFEKYYVLYLESNFNIKTLTNGCIFLEEEFCYQKTMDSLLGRKYGENFFIKERKIQKQKFKKLRNKEKANVLNDKKFYDHKFLENIPEFKDRKEKLRQYFKLYFKMENYQGSFGVEMSISKDGYIVDLNVFWPEILRNKNIEDNETVLKELNAFGKWESGKIYNENVNSVFIARI